MAVDSVMPSGMCSTIAEDARRSSRPCHETRMWSLKKCPASATSISCRNEWQESGPRGCTQNQGATRCAPAGSGGHRVHAWRHAEVPSDFQDEIENPRVQMQWLCTST